MADAPRRYTTEEAAAALDVPAGRIAEWKYHGRVVPVGYITSTGRGQDAPLYLLEELRPLVDAWRARTATRRAKAGDLRSESP